jgi:hypothetical protein
MTIPIYKSETKGNIKIDEMDVNHRTNALLKLLRKELSYITMNVLTPDYLHSLNLKEWQEVVNYLEPTLEFIEQTKNIRDQNLTSFKEFIRQRETVNS